MTECKVCGATVIFERLFLSGQLCFSHDTYALNSHRTALYSVSDGTWACVCFLPMSSYILQEFKQTKFWWISVRSVDISCAGFVSDGVLVAGEGATCMAPPGRFKKLPQLQV